jgi:hypothetical protein
VPEIFQHEPAYELQLLCAFGSRAFRVHNAGFPHFAASGELPQLALGASLAGGAKAAALLQQELRAALDGDAPLGAAQRRQAVALEALVRDALGDVAAWARLHSRFAAAAARRACVAPLALVVPGLVTNARAARLAARGVVDEVWCRHRAAAAYTVLVEQLAASAAAGAGGGGGGGGGGSGEEAFLFGARPHSLDALVFAHLEAVRLTAVGAWVREAAPSLVAYHARIRARYLAPAGAAGAAFALVAGGEVRGGSGPNVFSELEALVDAECAGAGAVAGAGAGAAFGEPSDAVLEAALRKHTRSAASNSTWLELARAGAILLVGAAAAARVYFISLH